MKTASASSSSTRNAKGVSTRDYPTVDGARASEITFENVDVAGVERRLARRMAVSR